MIKTTFYLILIFLFACKTNKIDQRNKTQNQIENNTIKNNKNNIYRGSTDLQTDILHMQLTVDFNYTNQTMHGIALLKIKQYSTPSNKITLDAKSFIINEIALYKDKKKQKLNYNYNNISLTIDLNETYTLNDTITLLIDYIAQPELIVTKTGKAITSDKGLYFINPVGKEKDKPRQIWTQGETEGARCWFPTNDSPNEKFTHEIIITADKKDVTLSNGELNKTIINSNNSHTDYWNMNLPNSPYLVMLAVGEFEIIKDDWKGKQVNYYVEKEYAPFAKANFGDTPEMMDYFSKTFGVDYPWQKYAQITVRDFVSGAMENTTATVHGEFLNKNKEDIIDAQPYDFYHEVVAHELVHQWFGDMATCESWANLPLNESFASYGEYLWVDFKYGKNCAQQHLYTQLQQYLDESESKQENMIRYFYDKPDDMFDAHSYQKGSRILHMLRNYVGDVNFFKAIQIYLKNNKFKNTELAHLRLAFEEATGKDLNWFFNQWFLNPGHPDLSYSYDYNIAKKILKLTVIQNQKNTQQNSLIYKLPTQLAIYTNNKAVYVDVNITKEIEEFEIPLTEIPAFVLLDAKGNLLSNNIKHTINKIEYLETLYYNSSSFNEYIILLYQLEKTEDSEQKNTLIKKIMNNDSWIIRSLVFQFMQSSKIKNELFTDYIIEHTKKEKNVLVRIEATSILKEVKRNENLTTLMQFILDNDSSISIKANALSYLANLENNKYQTYLEEFEKSKNYNMINAVGNYYSINKTANKLPFFKTKLNELKSFRKFSFLYYYQTYALNMLDTNIIKNVQNDFISLSNDINNPSWLKSYALTYLKELSTSLATSYTELLQTDRRKATTIKEAKEDIDKSLKIRLANETDKSILDAVNGQK